MHPALACSWQRFLPKCGPVAQLGARFHGMEEVVGSIPTRSTNHIYLPINNNLQFKHLKCANLVQTSRREYLPGSPQMRCESEGLYLWTRSPPFPLLEFPPVNLPAESESNARVFFQFVRSLRNSGFLNYSGEPL